VVEYGTSQDSLGLTSGSQHSGPDITATDVTYSVQLSNLEPATTYHYRVVATNTADRTTASGVQSFTTTARRELGSKITSFKCVYKLVCTQSISLAIAGMVRAVVGDVGAQTSSSQLLI